MVPLTLTSRMWPWPKRRQFRGVPITCLLPDEDRLRDHAVDALGAVDDLRHVVINRDARDHIGLLARQPGEALGEKKDGLAHSDLHCLFEIWIEPHYHPVSRRFGARPSQFHVLAQDELELAAIACLDRREVDLALTL